MGASAGTVVYVINHLDWFWSHRLPLARKALELGWEVLVAAPEATRTPALQAHGFRAAELAASGSERPLVALVAAFWQVRRLLKRERPAILHAITLKSALPAALAARWVGSDATVIATVAGLGYLFCSTEPKARLARRLLIPLIRHAFTGPSTWLIFQNSFDRDTLARLHAFRPERSVVIPGSGVDLSEFRYVAEPRTADPPIVLMAARLVREKGIAIFAEAARLVRERGLRAQFVLAGGLDQTNPSALSAEQMHALTADGALEWWGHVTDMVELYARCATFVYPSYYGEGVPKVLLEAAATGRPIVTTDHPGCRDVVADGINGLLVPPRDAQATADAIARLLGDPALRETLGRQGRERAVREFDVEQVVRRTIAVYAHAAAAASASALPGRRSRPEATPAGSGLLGPRVTSPTD